VAELNSAAERLRRRREQEKAEADARNRAASADSAESDEYARERRERNKKEALSESEYTIPAMSENGSLKTVSDGKSSNAKKGKGSK